MVFVKEYKNIQKNTLQGTFSIEIPECAGLVIREMAYFKKNESRWVSFPAKCYEKDGEKRYFPYLEIKDPGKLKAFQEKVIKALDDYFAKESGVVTNAKSRAVPAEQDDLPF